MKKVLTLCLFQQGDQLLLGKKKRGFGVNRWNGFGGKLHDTETVEQAAHREILEECGLVAQTMEQRGVLQFSFEDITDDLEVHVFAVTSATGKPKETEEMIPRWFPVNALPLNDMWVDDAHWMPFFLAGKHFAGRFSFKDTNHLLTHEVWEVT